MLNKLAASELVLNSDGSVYHLNLLPEDIAEKINSVIVSDTIRSEMRLRGFEQIKKFNKQDIAGQIMSGYRSIN